MKQAYLIIDYREANRGHNEWWSADITRDEILAQAKFIDKAEVYLYPEMKRVVKFEIVPETVIRAM